MNRGTSRLFKLGFFLLTVHKKEEKGTAEQAIVGGGQEAALVERLADLCQDEPQGRLLGVGHGASRFGGGGTR